MRKILLAVIIALITLLGVTVPAYAGDWLQFRDGYDYFYCEPGTSWNGATQDYMYVYYCWVPDAGKWIVTNPDPSTWGG